MKVDEYDDNGAKKFAEGRAFGDPADLFNEDDDVEKSKTDAGDYITDLLQEFGQEFAGLGNILTRSSTLERSSRNFSVC